MKGYTATCMYHVTMDNRARGTGLETRIILRDRMWVSRQVCCYQSFLRTVRSESCRFEFKTDRTIRKVSLIQNSFRGTRVAAVQGYHNFSDTPVLL